jgi:hypothetical protein
MMTATDLEPVILEHLQRSGQPVSDLYFLHRYEHDFHGCGVTQRRVEDAIRELKRKKLIRIVETIRSGNYDRQELLALAGSRLCTECGSVIESKKPSQRYCSKACVCATMTKRRVVNA